MTNVYFHCSDHEYTLAPRRGVKIESLVEACEHAERLVRSYVLMPNAEDWRNWVLHATGELGEELFSMPFASVVGKPH
jgi:hypothetical protein